MSAPLQKGDRAEVISGLGRSKSPNLGLTVTVGEAQGEHSQHGRIVRCHNPDLQQLTDGGGYKKLGFADFPVSWLRKIEPDAPPPTHAQVRKAITA